VLVDYIDRHRERLGVEPICRVLRRAGMLAPSSCYAAKTRPPSARTVADEQRLALIREVHEKNFGACGACGAYGVRKMHAELNRRGHPIAWCTVHRLMRADGLRGISRTKGPRTTIPGSGPDTRPDLLDRDFAAPAPNRVCVADITYCRTFAGWGYVAFVIDVYSRRMVGWQVSKSPRTDLAPDAPEMGLWTRQHDGHDTTGVTAHSMRYTQRLAEAGSVASERSTGDSQLLRHFLVAATRDRRGTACKRTARLLRGFDCRAALPDSWPGKRRPLDRSDDSPVGAFACRRSLECSDDGLTRSVEFGKLLVSQWNCRRALTTDPISSR